MATELSNYANDYRLRYRSADADNISHVGIADQLADYNVVPLPPEATYSMYSDGVGTSADPFVNYPMTPLPAAASFQGQVNFPDNDGLGPIGDRINV